jgi:hypothetical protein
MDATKSGPPGAAEGNAGKWVCRNCGTFNIDGTTHCSECGFARGYDPEEATGVTRGAVPAEVIETEDGGGRLALYLRIVQLALLAGLLVLVGPLAWRLQQQWPFQSPYDRDAQELAKDLLTVQARIEIGITKGEYELLLAPVLGENARFKGMYGTRPERQRDSYQKLVQAAEYHGFAEKTWDAQLTDAQTPLSLMPLAKSDSADKAVKDYWDRANANATDALKDL